MKYIKVLFLSIIMLQLIDLPMTTNTARKTIRSFIALSKNRRVAGPELLAANETASCLIGSQHSFVFIHIFFLFFFSFFFFLFKTLKKEKKKQFFKKKKKKFFIVCGGWRVLIKYTVLKSNDHSSFDPKA